MRLVLLILWLVVLLASAIHVQGCSGSSGGGGGTSSPLIAAPNLSTQFNAALQIENRGTSVATVEIDLAVFEINGVPVLNEGFEGATNWTIESAPVDHNCNFSPGPCSFRNTAPGEFVIDGSGRRVLRLTIPPGEYRAIFPCDQTLPSCDHPITANDQLEVRFSVSHPGGTQARVAVDFWIDRGAGTLAGTVDRAYVGGTGTLVVVSS